VVEISSSDHSVARSEDDGDLLRGPVGSCEGSGLVRVIHTCRVRKYLGAAQVVELAELLEDASNRVGVVDEVLQAAAEGRGMTLQLSEAEPELEDP
jgi:hypothetical protein